MHFGENAQNELQEATVELLRFIRENPSAIPLTVYYEIIALGEAALEGDADALALITGGALAALVSPTTLRSALTRPELDGAFDDRVDAIVAAFEARRDVDIDELDGWRTLDIGRFSHIEPNTPEEAQFLANAEATFGNSDTWTNVIRHRGELARRSRLR